MENIETLRENYNSRIEEKRRGYEITAAMFGYVVQRMQEAGIISGQVTISGRIKSFKSAYENSGKKLVDDCFGLRIIAEKKDQEKIREEIKRIFVVKSTKDHSKKKTGKYSAIHQMIQINEKYAENSGMSEEQFPEIEIQYWDEELKEKCVYGELSYANYKKRDLTAILKRLDEEPENALKDLPICYEIKGNSVRVLSSYEALYKLYPEIKELEEKRRTVTVPIEIEENENR